MTTTIEAPPVPDIDEATAARSALYGLLADALEFPGREFHTEIEGGVFRDGVEALISALPYDVDVAAAVPGLAEAGDYIPFQSEYMRLFDVGTVRPPCPLYDGEWGGARKHAMEEVLRFYRFFGLKLDDGTHELPDHATIELEFMKVLAYLEGLADQRGADPVPFLRAERDFLQRHPARWWPLLQRKLVPLEPQPFYASLATVVGAVLAADFAYTAWRIASAPVVA
jgi:putative dimethyl sulfoxide reductase chaperone